jgi:Flp pilus assembly protein protease CpaA
MVDLVARTSQDLGTTMQSSLVIKVHMILILRPRAPQLSQPWSRKRKTRSQLWMIVALIRMPQILIVMIPMLREKRRKSKREMLKRRL